ncbi:hypothetical protein [Chryseolinea sp. H1M3-3]|uniref:hypothetical protein n=1 Tax=Chryseolinea sp. H1M3-3 TaxID=3034144 RepID=UPI0023EB131B|nr:hypothetical protein [Chryseolinea sp. H1M3-3]
MTIELTEQEYKSTMTGKMTDVTASAKPVVDIWPYVEILRNEKIVPDYVFANELVESVYTNGDGSFHHVLLPTDNKNVLIILIIDVVGQRIKGHFKLDLTQQYGLS